MQLNFVQTIEMTSDATICQVGHEPNNDLVEYYLDGSKVLNKKCSPPMGQYSDISFSKETNRVPVIDFADYGIKSFPQIGAYGWFKCKYENVTKVLVPISADRQRYPAPTLVVTQVGGNMHCEITPPAEVTYECYRIVMRYGFTANEYITYDTVVDIPKPYPDANYTVYCVGYRPDGQISEDSTYQLMLITGGENPRPDPPVPYNIQEQLDAKIDRVELEDTDKLRFYGNDVLIDEVTINPGIARYIHDQAIAASDWTVTHNLGVLPNAFVVSSAGDTVYGQLTHQDANTLIISFNAPFTGKAYLS